MRALLLAPAALLLVLAACGRDDPPDVTGVDDAQVCLYGPTAVGELRRFTLGGPEGCSAPHVFVRVGASGEEPVATAVFTADLQAGQGYSIQARDFSADPGALDPTLAIAPGATRADLQGWLAASDDESGFLDAALVFIPPATARYAIVVQGRNPADAGTMRLTMQGCAVSVLVGNGTTRGALATPSCYFSADAPLFATDSTRVGIHRLPLAAGEARRITVTSTAFVPGIFVGGPGEDLFWYRRDVPNVSQRAAAWGPEVSVVLVAPRTGTYTLFVGGGGPGAVGAYDVRVEPASPASP